MKYPVVLNPSHHFQRFIHVESPQGQNYLQENPKLRERNGWSFFFPILFSDEAFALSRFFMLPGQADDASGNTGNRKFSEFGE